MIGLAALSAAACTSDRRAADVVVRDSAGIRIVAYRNPLFELGTEWSVDSIPVVTIGVAEGDADYELVDVVTAVRLQDGTLVIADRGRNQLLAFDANGRFLRAVGGPGVGPGEFGNMGWLQLVGSDTLFVYDRDIRRVTAFTLEGGLAGIITLPEAAFAWPGNVRTGNGTFVLALVGSDRSHAGRPGSAARGSSTLAAWELT